MIGKTVFFLVVIYFLYQVVVLFRPGPLEKKISGVAIAAIVVPLACTDWPIYLNGHIAFGIVALLYAIGMFYECIKNKRGLYFLTGVILLIFSVFEVMRYIENPSLSG